MTSHLPLRVLFVALLLPLGAAPAAAQSHTNRCTAAEGFPCRLQLEGAALTRVPARLRVQARVANAKLPVGEGLFPELVVKVLRGTEEVCRERFEQVTVRQGVLNFEIGANMSCDLDEEIAQRSDLSLQICLRGSESCLRPMAFGTTANVIKASFAAVARKAHRVQTAAQAHYAMALTADPDLRERRRIDAGLLDFRGPAATDVTALYDQAFFSGRYQGGGFLQWAPVRRRTARSLHVSGKDAGSHRLTSLGDLSFEARRVVARGGLEVAGGATGLRLAAGNALLEGATHQIAGALSVGAAGAQAGQAGLQVDTGGAAVGGDATVAGALRVVGQVRAGEGVAVLDGDVVVRRRGASLVGESDVSGAIDVGGALSVSGPTTVGGDLVALAAVDVGAADGALTAFEVRDGELIIDSQEQFDLLRLHTDLLGLDDWIFEGRVTIGRPAGFCPRGQTPDGQGACVDLDECAAGVHDCDATFGRCVNTDGAFECHCGDGYTGTYPTCTDVDECAAGTHTCGAGRTCANTQGGFDCRCAAGTTDAFDGTCRPTLTVFVTEATRDYNGDYTGRNGAGFAEADQICADEARAAGLTGDFLAYLYGRPTGADPVTHVGTSLSQRFDRLVVRPDGVVVARSLVDMSAATLLAPINVTAKGDELPGVFGDPDAEVWTGQKIPGQRLVQNCSDWANTHRGANNGGRGSYAITDGRWERFANRGCNTQARYYCFER